MSLEIKIKEMRVTPVAIADPPLRSSYGLHQPYALRTILELESEDGIVGVSETYGGEAPMNAPPQHTLKNSQAEAAEPPSRLRSTLATYTHSVGTNGLSSSAVAVFLYLSQADSPMEKLMSKFQVPADIGTFMDSKGINQAAHLAQIDDKEKLHELITSKVN